MAKLKDSLIFKLILGVVVGLIVGLYSNQTVGLINTIKFLLGQVISFTIPLIILGFIAPAITQMKSNASKMLGVMIGLAYISSVGAALMSMVATNSINCMLNITSAADSAKKVIPELIFKVEIPPTMSVMSALFFGNICRTCKLCEKFKKL